MYFLYRYLGNQEYIFDTIFNKRLYCSNPKNFNDPYDCRPKFSLLSCKNEPDEVWRNYYIQLEKVNHPSLTDDEIIKLAEAKFLKGEHRNDEWLIEEDLAIRKAHHDGSPRICCFSRSPRNAMMWAFYANNHKGVVLQFNKSILRDECDWYKGHSVDYYSRYITLKKYVNTMNEAIQGDCTAYYRLIFGSKSCEWSNEQEERFFSSVEYLKYPEEMLTGILFGSNTPENLQDSIIQELSRWRTKPRLFKENLLRSGIKLNFKTISY